MKAYSNLFSEVLVQQFQSIENSVNLLLSLDKNSNNLNLIQQVYNRLEFSTEAGLNLLVSLNSSNNKGQEDQERDKVVKEFFKYTLLKLFLNILYQKSDSTELKTFIYQKLDTQSTESVNNKLLGLLGILENERPE